MSKTGKSGHRRSRHDSKHKPESGLVLLRGVDAGILGAIFAVPFIMGGRVPLGEFALLFSASVGAVCWAAYSIGRPELGWVSSKAEPLLIAIVLLGMIQIAPLPTSLITKVSPEVKDALPLWQGGENAMGSWKYLSLSPAESRAGLPTGVALVLIFIVTVQRIRRVEDAERILRWVAISGIAMATLGVVQYAFANGSYYWFFRFREVSTADHLTGAFPNKNLFAEFMGLTIGPIIWWLMTAAKIAKSDKNDKSGSWATKSMIPQQLRGAFLMLGLSVVVIALFLSLSRGGIIAVGFGVTAMLLVLFRKSLVPGRTVASFFGIGTLAVGLLFVVGGDRVTRAVKRLDNWNDSGRYQIWNANLDVLSDFPVMGTGVGSHRYIYHRYLNTPHSESVYTHAENAYLQIASENGLFGFGLCVLCLMLCFWWCARGASVSQHRSSTIALTAIACTLVSSCLHNIVDFGWFIQGTMSVFVVLMACGCRLYQLELGTAKPEKKVVERHVPRPIAIGLACLFLMTGIWMMGSRAPAIVAAGPMKQFSDLRAEIDAIELSGDEAEKQETGNHVMKLFRQKLLSLHAAVKADPQNAELHYLLSRDYMVLFELLQNRAENAMTLAQLRDTVMSGGFESQQEVMDWLKVAVGDNLKYAIASGKHAERALQLNPIQANAYLQAAETGFLLGRKPGFAKECIAQALELWPYDGQVLFIAGRDAAAAGDLTRMMELWKAAFHSQDRWQESIIRYVVAQVSDPVPLMLAEFNPDIDALERIVKVVETAGNDQDREQALTKYSTELVARAQQAENSNRVDDWLRAGTAFDKLGQPEKVTACLEKAFEAEPSSFVVRFEFGVWLHRQREHRLALEHFEWCQLMQPDHPKLERLMQQAERAAYGDVRQASGADSPTDSTGLKQDSSSSSFYVPNRLPAADTRDDRSSAPLSLPDSAGENQ